MEQMVMIIAIFGLMYFGFKTKAGIFNILAGLLSFAFALTMVTDTFVFIIFVGLAIYLIASVFVSRNK